MKNKTMQKVKHFLKKEVGVTSIEYALMGSLIAVAIFTSVQLLGTNVLALYNDVAVKVAAAVNN